MSKQPQQSINTNPFRRGTDEYVVSPITPVDSPVEQRPLDSEKRFPPHTQAGPNAPSMHATAEQQHLNSSQPPPRDADKVAVDSWQTESRQDGAPIPTIQHEDSSGLLNDYKGAPPPYEAVSARFSSERDLTHTQSSVSAIQPNDSEPLPPRPEDRSAVGQLLSWIPSRVPSQQFPPLVQPIIIPQVDVPPRGENVPFVRCYSDALAAHAVTMREFVAFLDGLAVSQAPGSTAQGFKMFGVGVSRVPLPLIPLAGHAVKAISSAGSGDSSSRAKLYLERAKKEYFAPRSLRLSVVNDSDLNARLQISPHADRLAPLTRSTLSNNLSERRLESVSPYVSPLRYDVPTDEQVSGVHKLARKYVQSQINNNTKKVAALREDQWKDISFSAFPQQEWENRYVAKVAAVRRSQVFLAQNAGAPGADPAATREGWDALLRDREDLAALVRERQDGVQRASAQGIAMQAEMEEEKWARNLKWIVIDNLQ